MNVTDPRLVCATDFSPRAKRAAILAAKLARQRGEPLRLVFVSEATDPGVIATERGRLSDEAASLRKLGADVQPLLLTHRDATEGLLEHVRRTRPTLVIIASGAKGALDRWTLGSFSEQVAEASPVPTLVAARPAAFDKWDVREPVRILLALDFFPSSDVVLRWANEFRKGGPCDFVACHVNQRQPTAEEAAVAPGLPRNPPAVQARLERELRKKLRDVVGNDAREVVVRAHFGDPASCIADIAEEVQAQIIVVGAHQRTGLRRLAGFSVSRELLHTSGANVVCVPVTASFDPREAHIPEYRRLLVATDFSDVGNAVVPFALAAGAEGCQLKIVHVVRPGTTAGGELRRKLMRLVPAELGETGPAPEVEVLEDRDVANAIAAEAERFGADLVAIASHGGGASRALHGSVAKALLKSIRRPLLVIRRPDE
jgi:nucleotide-binding universal stress UspA family protein